MIYEIGADVCLREPIILSRYSIPKGYAGVVTGLQGRDLVVVEFHIDGTPCYVRFYRDESASDGSRSLSNLEVLRS